MGVWGREITSGDNQQSNSIHLNIMKLKLSSIGNVHTTLVVLSLALLAQTTSAETWFTNEVWVSPIAQTNGGNGTLDYPYDGSTQAKFDALMNNLPANTTIHLLAGTYQTYGVDSWSVKSGQKISGSGMDVTILQLVPTSLDNQPVVISSHVNTTNVEVSDLTVDGNAGAISGKNKLNGVYLCGTRHAIRRVKAINLSAEGAGYEAFGIVISATADGEATVNSDGNIIEECEVSQFQASGSSRAISAISFNGLGPISGIIRNNRVFLNGNPTNNAEQAINGAWSHDVLIEGNYIDGAFNGYYGDTGGCTNIIIAHNTFRNCYSAVSLSNSKRKNITIAFNNITLPPTGPVAFNLWNGSDPTVAITNVLIMGNTIDNSGQSGSTSYLIAAADITGLVIANNTVDPIIAANQAAQGTNTFINNANVSMYNNYDLYGNFLTNLNQVASPNGVTRRTVTSNHTIGFITNYVSYADQYIGVKGNWGGGVGQKGVDIVLPSGVGYAGKDFIVADETGQLQSGLGPFLIISTTSPNTINGRTSITNFTPYAAMTVINDGTNWFAH
jgi:hypothetical protein